MKKLSLLKTAAAYIRVSDDRQDEYSPDSQLKLIREYADRNGYEVPDEYVYYDDGISAKTAQRRPAFNQMIGLAKEKNRPFDVIYVWKFSRFARNQEESIVYKNLLKKKGVEVVSVSEPIPEGPWGSLIERIIEWMDEYYLINLSVEVKRGMTEKASRGEPLCAPAFGYDLDSASKRYTVNGEQAPIVREVFERFIAGEGVRAIAISLRDRGIRTIRGNPPDNRFIEYMICNPVYAGKIRWSTTGKMASLRKFDKDNFMIVDGHHEAIVPPEVWEKAQQVYKARKAKYGKYQRPDQPIEWMLKGLVRCDTCGSTLVHSCAKEPAMQCHRYSKGSCPVSHHVSMKKADAAVIAALEKAVGEKSFTMAPDRPEKIKAAGPDYAALLQQEERRLARAKDAYLAGADTLEEYSHNKAAISERIALIEREMSQTRPEPQEILDYAEKVRSVLEFIKSPEVSPQAKNDALRTVVDHIDFEKAKNNFAVYFYA